jgi:hypothetical protein
VDIGHSGLRLPRSITMSGFVLSFPPRSWMMLIPGHVRIQTTPSSYSSVREVRSDHQQGIGR